MWQIQIFGKGIHKPKLHARIKGEQIKFRERLLLLSPQSFTFPLAVGSVHMSVYRKIFRLLFGMDACMVPHVRGSTFV